MIFVDNEYFFLIKDIKMGEVLVYLFPDLV